MFANSGLLGDNDVIFPGPALRKQKQKVLDVKQKMKNRRKSSCASAARFAERENEQETQDLVMNADQSNVTAESAF